MGRLSFFRSVWSAVRVLVVVVICCGICWYILGLGFIRVRSVVAVLVVIFICCVI